MLSAIIVVVAGVHVLVNGARTVARISISLEAGRLGWQRIPRNTGRNARFRHKYQMAKLIDGHIYLSPLEASAALRISYKTLQRWAEGQQVSYWSKGKRCKREVKIDMLVTPTGFRLYSQASIQSLVTTFKESNNEHKS